MFRQLGGNKAGNTGERAGPTAVDSAFQGHHEAVIELTMEKTWPTRKWRIAKSQMGTHLQVKLMENNVNGNGVRIERVDSWGIE